MTTLFDSQTLTSGYANTFGHGVFPEAAGRLNPGAISTNETDTAYWESDTLTDTTETPVPTSSDSRFPGFCQTERERVEAAATRRVRVVVQLSMTIRRARS